jgi:hypothetical protein
MTPELKFFSGRLELSSHRGLKKMDFPATPIPPEGSGSLFPCRPRSLSLADLGLPAIFLANLTLTPGFSMEVLTLKDRRVVPGGNHFRV